MEFGCRLSTYDIRDIKLKASAAVLVPDEYACPVEVPVKNQGSVSSCVAHAVSTILEYHTGARCELSTNFIYGIQKKLFDRSDKGMYLRDACKIVAEYGDMLLDDCPGNSEVPVCHTVAENAFNDVFKLEKAKVFRVLKYFLCPTADDIKHALYNYGPVLASIRWYDTFKVNKNGVLYGEQTGKYTNHAVVIYGYTKDGFWCQNSWGKLWGKKGKFFLPNNIEVREARGFVDIENEAEVSELVEPNNNSLLRIIYKCINMLVNSIRILFIK